MFISDLLNQRPSTTNLPNQWRMCLRAQGFVVGSPAAMHGQSSQSTATHKLPESGHSRATTSPRGSHLDGSEGASATAASVGECRLENLSDPIHEHAHALGEIAPMRI